MAAPKTDPEDFTPDPRSIDLRDYWLAVRRRWRLVMGVTALAGLLGAGYGLSAQPSYTATAEVLVAPLTQGPLSASSQPNHLVNISTEQAVAQSGAVASRTAASLRMPASAVASHLTVAVPALSDLLLISWRAGSAAAAQQGANAAAGAYLSYRHQVLAGQLATLEKLFRKQVGSLGQRVSQVSAKLALAPSHTAQHDNFTTQLAALNSELSKASDLSAALPTYDDSGGRIIAAALPLSPSGLGKGLILTLAVLLGLLAGTVAALLREAFDDRLRDPADLERALNAATLAVVPAAGAAARRGGSRAGNGGQGVAAPLAAITEPAGQAAQSVWALRSTLGAAAARQGMRSILIAVPDASVSAGRIAAELAVVLAGSGQRVLLVASDLRSSSLPEIFGMPGGRGLTDVLAGQGEAELPILRPRLAGTDALSRQVAGRLRLLPSGLPVLQPLSVLSSAELAGLLRSQRDTYDYVLLDSPPVSAAPDAIALAAHVDGVVVAARLGAHGEPVAQLRHRLGQVGAHIAGGLLVTSGPAGRNRRQSGQPPAPLPATAAGAADSGWPADRLAAPPWPAGQDFPAAAGEWVPGLPPAREVKPS